MKLTVPKTRDLGNHCMLNSSMFDALANALPTRMISDNPKVVHTYWGNVSFARGLGDVILLSKKKKRRKYEDPFLRC